MGVSHFNINVQRSCLHQQTYGILSEFFWQFLANSCVCSSSCGTANSKGSSSSTGI